MATPRHGESIEEYEVLEFLGKGGFAQVYRAQCRRSGTYVAVKMIDKGRMESAGMVERVRQEVAIQSRLKHPSILELYTFFEDARYVYLILELAQNGELARYFRLDANGLGEQMAADILRQVVDGVLYLHSHRILHRDLSLNNLLLTKDLRVKIADFGLATQLNEPDEKHMTMCGTPNYISPEVASRSNHGLPADVWGLGCLLYTLLVGKPPFDTRHVKHTLNRVIHSDYQMPSGLSNEAQDLLDRLLRKNPAERISLVQMARHPFLSKSTHDRPYPHIDVNRDSGIHTTSHSTQHNRTRSEERKTNSASYNQHRHNSMDKLTNNYKRPSSFNVLTGIANVDKHNVYKNKYDNGSGYSSCNQSESDGSAIPYTNSYEGSENIKKNNEINHINYKTNEEIHSVHISSEKMDTNTVKNFGIENKENIVTGNRSIGVPPLCSARLCEFSYKTRNAELSLSQCGSVTIKFFKKRGQYREERITEVCTISKDGMQVIIYPVGGSKGHPLSEPLPPHTPSTQEIYTYHNIPQKHWRKYLYASRFVDLVKAKTPKITIYTEQAKCHLMENGTDFEVKFYTGEKFTLANNVVKIVDEDGNTIPNNIQTQKAHEHFQECMARCLQIETALVGLSEDCFPLIMGRLPQSLTASGSNNPGSQQTTPNMPNVGSINIGSFCHSSGNSVSHTNAIENMREFSSSSIRSNQLKTFNPNGERTNPFQLKTNQMQSTTNNASNAAYFNDRRLPLGSYRNGNI